MKKIKKGDNVQIMRGKDAGKSGLVQRVVATKNKKNKEVFKVVVSGVNIVKKSQKPNPQLGIAGGVLEIEKPIDVSNVMLIDKKLNVPTRVGFKIDDKTGKKVRYSKKSGEII